MKLTDALGLKNTIDESMTEAATRVRDNNAQITSSLFDGESAEVQYYDAQGELDRWRKLSEAQVKLKTVIAVKTSEKREAVERMQAIDKEVKLLLSLPVKEGKQQHAARDQYESDPAPANVTTTTVTIKQPMVDAALATLKAEKKKLQRELNAFNHETTIDLPFEESDLPLTATALKQEEPTGGPQPAFEPPSDA